MPHVGSEAARPHEESREVELKFALSAMDAARLPAQPPWDAAGFKATRRLRSIYFDTPDRALQQSGFSLRIREEDGKRIQTVKTMNRDGSGLAERGEWSSTVRSLKPDLGLKTTSVLQSVLSAANPERSLQAIFTVDVIRHCWEISYGDSRIEIAVDSGNVAAGEHREPFSELELELLEGRKTDLFKLARDIFRRLPLRLHPQSKAERGYEMLADAVGHRKAGKVTFGPDIAVRQAFQRIVRGCLSHLLANVAAFWRTRSPDSVHQSRVAIRRLRAAMALFREFTRDDMHGRLNDELRWIAGELGVARELDVYIEEVLDKAGAGLVGTPEYALLRTEYEQRRERAYRDAEILLESPRFFYAILVLAEWIECGSWLDVTHGEEPCLSGYAVRQLKRRWKKVRRGIRRHEKFDDETRHAWRIDVKKLRYAADFFAPLYPASGSRNRGRDDPLRIAMKQMANLQDNLGILNDIAEARDKNPLSDIAHRLYRERLALRDGLMRKINENCAALVKVMPFWKGRISADD